MGFKEGGISARSGWIDRHFKRGAADHVLPEIGRLYERRIKDMGRTAPKSVCPGGRRMRPVRSSGCRTCGPTPRSSRFPVLIRATTTLQQQRTRTVASTETPGLLIHHHLISLPETAAARKIKCRSFYRGPKSLREYRSGGFGFGNFSFALQPFATRSFPSR
jgi:hypothetical protein